MCIHTAYATGSLEGSPAFLGNFPDVGLIFLIYTKERSISVPGSWNFFTSSIVPPRTLTAFLAFTYMPQNIHQPLRMEGYIPQELLS